MDALTQLFSQYSVETLIILVITLAVAIKFVSELFSYFYSKFKTYFNYVSAKDARHNEIIEGIGVLKEEISNLQEIIHNQSKEIRSLQEHEQLSLERLQENSRSYIIDKHHHFCYEVRAIDDLNLQSLERRYLYYKAAGGNSFIDGLMEEIRELPKIDLSNPQLLEAIHNQKGVNK